MTPDSVALTAAGGFAGGALASFLNVALYRLPRGESVVRPRSHCETCGAAVRAFDNVPVISWLVLRGACRACHAPIASGAFAFELCGAALGALIASRFVT